MAESRVTKGRGAKDPGGSAGTRRSPERQFPSFDPDLSPTARKLLEAARHLLESSGYASLSLDAIGREAGENKSLIWYHFGGKAGLLLALNDWLIYDIMKGLQAAAARPGPTDGRRGEVLDWGRRLATDAETMRAFFDLLPHLLENGVTRRRMADYYARYREINAMGIAEPGESGSSDARALAAVQMAITDGLALQLLLDPGSVDMQRIYELWEKFVATTLSPREGEGGAV